MRYTNFHFFVLVFEPSPVLPYNIIYSVVEKELMGEARRLCLNFEA